MQCIQNHIAITTARDETMVEVLPPKRLRWIENAVLGGKCNNDMLSRNEEALLDWQAKEAIAKACCLFPGPFLGELHLLWSLHTVSQFSGML